MYDQLKCYLKQLYAIRIIFLFNVIGIFIKRSLQLPAIPSSTKIKNYYELLHTF